MTTLSVEIENERESFRPGEVVRGRVTWQDHTSHDELTINLRYYTEGIGTVDFIVVDSVAITSPQISGEQSFSFTLPPGPYSFEGKLITLIWGVELVYEDEDLSESTDFKLTPNESDSAITLHKE